MEHQSVDPAVYVKLAPIARAFADPQLHTIGVLAINECPTPTLIELLECCRSCDELESFPGGHEHRELLENYLVSELSKR